MKKILSLCIAVLIIVFSFAGCKEEQRDVSDLAIYSQNFGINEAMVEYYLNLQYKTFVNLYSDNLEDIGLDTSLPLAEQKCTLDTTKATWYDYFMDSVKEKLSDYLIVAEKAKEDGMKLLHVEKQKIDENIELLKEAAEAEDTKFSKYISQNYGKSVTEEDIRACMELETLATRMYNEYSESLDLSNMALEKYFSSHKKAYCTVSYLCFQIDGQTSDSSEAISISKAASNIASKNSEKKFLEAVKDYVVNYYTNHRDEFESDEIEEIAEKAASDCRFEDVAYYSGNAGVRWAFEEERIAGDTTVIKDEENNLYYVYYLLSPMKRDEYKTVNIRQILFSLEDYETYDKALFSAEECKRILEERTFAESTFKALAKQYSSDSLTKNSGGYYENVFKGTFDQSVEEIEEWIFSEDREEGNIEIIKTSLGQHLIYLEELSDEAWEVRVRNDLKDSRFNSYLSDLGDEYKLHINSNIIYSIGEITLSKHDSAA